MGDKHEEPADPLDLILAPLKDMNAEEQLAFWRAFRVAHRRRIVRTEAQLCPDLLIAVDAQIAMLAQMV